HCRSNGRSPAAGSSWQVSFSSVPPSPFQEPCFQALSLPERQWTLPQAQPRPACPAPARRRPAGIREPPTTRPPSHETVSAWEAPVLANAVSGPILLRPQPSAHRDFGQADGRGRGLAVLGPAAGREDEGQPAALPLRTESGAGGWLG